MQKISWWNTEFDQQEVEAISSSICNKKIGMGSVTKEFEDNISKMLDVSYVIATPSGSSALYISLMVLGIGQGDEVIVPDRTFIATAHAVQLTGATVILVDSNKNNTNINISKIKEKITNKTKAIIPVYLNGRSVDVDLINKIAKKNNLFVVEDSCQSLFSKNNKNNYLGTIGNVGCFSLGLSKLITVGFGGFITTNDKELYEKILRFRNHGKVNNEDLNYNILGFNFKVSDMIMSLGNVQLSKYKEKINHLKIIYSLYESALNNLKYIDLISVDIKYEVPLYIEVTSQYRDKIIDYLKMHNVETSLLPPSLHLSQHLKQEDNDYNNSLFFNNNSFILPCGPNQNIKNIKTVIQLLEKFKYGNTL